MSRAATCRQLVVDLREKEPRWLACFFVRAPRKGVATEHSSAPKRAPQVQGSAIPRGGASRRANDCVVLGVDTSEAAAGVAGAFNHWESIIVSVTTVSQLAKITLNVRSRR